MYEFPTPQFLLCLRFPSKILHETVQRYCRYGQWSFCLCLLSIHMTLHLTNLDEQNHYRQICAISVSSFSERMRLLGEAFSIIFRWGFISSTASRVFRWQIAQTTSQLENYDGYIHTQLCTRMDVLRFQSLPLYIEIACRAWQTPARKPDFELTFPSCCSAHLCMRAIACCQ